MKRWGVFVSILLAFALLVSVPFSAQAITYSKTYYDPAINGVLVQENSPPGGPGATDDTFTIGANFSSGFNLKVVQIDVDTVLNNGTVVYTMTFPCQAGNGNPSTDAECAALNLQPSCADNNPNLDCLTTLLGNDAPDTAPADSESYRVRMINTLWPDPNPAPAAVIVIEITPGILSPNTNVAVTQGAGVLVSPASINFATLVNPKQIVFTLTNVNPVLNLNQSWGFYAFANAEEDGPGEDSFRADVQVDQPGLNCVSESFDKTILTPPGGVVKATAAVQNTGDLDMDDVVITKVMSNAAKMTIVPGTSTIGDPLEGPPGTWTFPIQALAGGATLNFSFDVSITGMLATDQLCDQITVASEEFGISSDGPRCRACVTAKVNGVPALGTIGYSVALAMLTMGGVMLYRQRRRRA
jgi:hypothetical protein